MIEVIAKFNKLMSEATSKYMFLSEELNKWDKEQQDILHLIECSTNCKGRSKLATKLKRLRNERREIKNELEYYQLLMPFVEKNRTAIGELQRLLGEIRKAEQKQSKPIYFMRTSGEILEVNK